MSFKSRLFGFGVAALLSLGMVAGVMAENTAEGTITATLSDNDSTAVCTLTVESANADFGVFVYDAEKVAFVPADGDGTVGINGEVTAERPDGYGPGDDLNCQLQIQGLNLYTPPKNPGGDPSDPSAYPSAIGMSNIMVNHISVQRLVNNPQPVEGEPEVGTLVDLTLTEVESMSGFDDQGNWRGYEELGDYEGSVTLTVVPADS